MIEGWDLVALAIKLRMLRQQLWKLSRIKAETAFGAFLKEAFWESELPEIIIKDQIQLMSLELIKCSLNLTSFKF